MPPPQSPHQARKLCPSGAAGPARRLANASVSNTDTEVERGRQERPRGVQTSSRPSPLAS